MLIRGSEMRRICKQCGAALPLDARPNREFCPNRKCKRLAWDKTAKLKRHLERRTSNAAVFEQYLWGQTSHQMQHAAPEAAQGYRVIIKRKNGSRLVMPQPGATWHLTFEGNRSPGDYYQLFPLVDRPRVPVNGEYQVLYVDSHGHASGEPDGPLHFAGCRMSVPSGKASARGQTAVAGAVDLPAQSEKPAPPRRPTTAVRAEKNRAAPKPSEPAPPMPPAPRSGVAEDQHTLNTAPVRPLAMPTKAPGSAEGKPRRRAVSPSRDRQDGAGVAALPERLVPAKEGLGSPLAAQPQTLGAQPPSLIFGALGLSSSHCPADSVEPEQPDLGKEGQVVPGESPSLAADASHVESPKSQQVQAQSVPCESIAGVITGAEPPHLTPGAPGLHSLLVLGGDTEPLQREPGIQGFARATGSPEPLAFRWPWQAVLNKSVSVPGNKAELSHPAPEAPSLPSCSSPLVDTLPSQLPPIAATQDIVAEPPPYASDANDLLSAQQPVGSDTALQLERAADVHSVGAGPQGTESAPKAPSMPSAQCQGVDVFPARPDPAAEVQRVGAGPQPTTPETASLSSGQSPVVADLLAQREPDPDDQQGGAGLPSSTLEAASLLSDQRPTIEVLPAQHKPAADGQSGWVGPPLPAPEAPSLPSDKSLVVADLPAQGEPDAEDQRGRAGLPSHTSEAASVPIDQSPIGADLPPQSEVDEEHQYIGAGLPSHEPHAPNLPKDQSPVVVDLPAQREPDETDQSVGVGPQPAAAEAASLPRDQTPDFADPSACVSSMFR